MKGKEKFIGSAVLLVVIAIFLIVGYTNTRPEKLTDDDMKKMFIDIPTEQETIKEEINNRKIIVEIKGEVSKPDVYYLDEGSRIYELIEMAGGVTANADLATVNRASTLMDGQCIIIGNIDDKNIVNSNNLGGTSNVSLGQEQRININTAPKEELIKLTGVGDSKAEAIIEYRNKNGGFKKVEDLKNVDGIGEKTVEKLKDKICVN